MVKNEEERKRVYCSYCVKSCKGKYVVVKGSLTSCKQGELQEKFLKIREGEKDGEERIDTSIL